jgi:hypothetical protein
MRSSFRKIGMDWRINIKMHLKETEYRNVDLCVIHLTPDKDQLWALVNIVLNIPTTQKASNFLRSCKGLCLIWILTLGLSVSEAAVNTLFHLQYI